MRFRSLNVCSSNGYPLRLRHHQAARQSTRRYARQFQLRPVAGAEGGGGWAHLGYACAGLALDAEVLALAVVLCVFGRAQPPHAVVARAADRAHGHGHCGAGVAAVGGGAGHVGCAGAVPGEVGAGD